MILGAVTIRERVERARIEDPFVVDQFVVFGTGSGAELIMFGIPVHAVCLDEGGDTRLVLRCPEFVQGVLFEELIAELRLSFSVEGETADLASLRSCNRSFWVLRNRIRRCGRLGRVHR